MASEPSPVNAVKGLADRKQRRGWSRWEVCYSRHAVVGDPSKDDQKLCIPLRNGEILVFVLGNKITSDGMLMDVA